MRTLMGVVKDRHGTYYARKKVPKNLEAAVAKNTDAGRPRVSWLKASLRTKDLKQANTDAKVHLARFDSSGGTGRQYGAKHMVRRYGVAALRDAVALVAYPGVMLPERKN